MSKYNTICHRCGLFNQTHCGEYPSLCKLCSDYMAEEKQRRIEFVSVDSLGNDDRGGIGSTGTK